MHTPSTRRADSRNATKAPRHRSKATHTMAAPPEADVSSNTTAELPGEHPIYELIAEAAYFRAEKRGFEPGHELEDWLEAEAEVAQRC